MADLIDRMDAPTIEPEVRHGEWIPAKSTLSSKCSACGKYSPSESPFCPRCGARMDADEIAERRAAADDYAEY